MQGQDVMSQVKHFAAYNQETYRNTPADDVIVSTRALHEIYLPAFLRGGTQADAASVMCAYSMVNGNFACQQLLPAEHRAPRRVGFPRLRYLRLRRRALDAGALEGTDMEQPESTYYGNALKAAVQKGHPVAAR